MIIKEKKLVTVAAAEALCVETEAETKFRASSLSVHMKQGCSLARKQRRMSCIVYEKAGFPRRAIDVVHIVVYVALYPPMIYFFMRYICEW